MGSERVLIIHEKIAMSNVEQSLDGRAEGSAFAQRPSRVCLRSFFVVHLLLPGSPSPTPRNLQVAGVRAGYRHRLAAVPVSDFSHRLVVARFSGFLYTAVFLLRYARAIEI